MTLKDKFLAAEQLFYRKIDRRRDAWRTRYWTDRLRSPQDLRGTRCHCPTGIPIHFVHQEGIRECADVILDHSSLLENPDRPQVPLGMVESIAPMIPRAAIVYLITNILPSFVDTILPRITNPIVLITAESDWNATVDFAHLLDHPKILHWFCQNGALPDPHPRLTQIPIGINNPIFTDFERRVGSFVDQILGKSAFDPTGKINQPGNQRKFNTAVEANRGLAGTKRLRVLASYTKNRRSQDRIDAERVLRQADFALFLDVFLSPERYWMLHREFAFEASPAGNGLDCYRTWEALALRTVPIVRTSPLDRLYREHGFPVAIVDSWDDITPRRLEEWNDSLVPMLEDCQPRLANEYWVDLIYRKAKEFR